MGYIETVERLNSFLWLLDFLMFLSVLWYAKKDKEFNSTLVTLLVSIVLGGVMTAYSPSLGAFIQNARLPTGDIIWLDIGLFAWYVGFALFNLASIMAIFKIHVWYKKNYSFITYAYLLAFFLLGNLQIVQYAEILTFNQGHVENIYKLGILSINIGVSLTTIMIVLGVTISRYLIKRGKKGLSWSL